MTVPNMRTNIELLERSLQNCSLNQNNTSSTPDTGGGIGLSSSTDSPENRLSKSSDSTLELNSQISLPYHWEQCLDLKTGEIYYINWSTGMRAKEDPRTTTTSTTRDIYHSEEDDDEEEDSEESSTDESSPSSCSRNQKYHRHDDKKKKREQVLVVAGCKSCLMYFMVPKVVQDCPKCYGQLLHFDRSENLST